MSETDREELGAAMDHLGAMRWWLHHVLPFAESAPDYPSWYVIEARPALEKADQFVIAVMGADEAERMVKFDQAPHAREAFDLRAALSASRLLCAEQNAALEEIDRAVVDRGTHPEYHQRTMAQHRQEWPILWRAIDHARAVLARHAAQGNGERDE